MRADEPISIFELEDVDYINQLRVERLMAKARELNCLADEHYGRLEYYDYNKCLQCYRIAEAYEERAKRIKEGM